ncbi:hypothetical protein [Aquimarina sediminis]|uniref:hypothetical protein n=1 Tax=Aquimarina sediminis TaxID=2070536 RepID=UPI000CA018B1|nr:hypothetical protein [Aquimarina sediminis]
MKFKSAFIILTIISFTNVFGQINEEYKALIKEASSLYKSKNYKLSVVNYEKAFKIFEGNNSDLYNAACSAALDRDPEKAKTFLISSINSGWSNLDHLQKDPDLYSLHCLDEWKEIIKKAEEVEKNTVTHTQLIDKIKPFIESNKPESVYDLANNDLKSRPELKTTIDSIYQLLKRHKVKNLQSIRSASSSSVNYINGLKTESFYYTYKLNPKYLNGKVKSFFFKPLGYKIKIEVSKPSNEWLLSNISLENKYANPDYEMVTENTSFFKNSDSLIYRYSLAKNTKVLYNQGKVKSENIRDVIIRELKQLDYVKFSDVKTLNVFKESSKIYSLSFYSNKKDSFFQTKNIGKSSKTLKTVELMFYDNNSNLVLVSNGNKYAFYRVKSVERLKEIVLKEVAEITK